MAAQLHIPRHRSRTEDLESSSLHVHLGLAWWKINPLPQWARKRDTGSLPSVSLQSEREVVRTINTRENFLQMVQRSPRLSTRRMASRIGVSRMQVWRTLHEEDLNPYHDQMVHLEPGDYVQRMDLCHWVTAHPELLSLILFTDETSFTWEGINNLRNVHTWSHRNPHATCVTHFQKRFSVNVWCGVLGISYMTNNYIIN